MLIISINWVSVPSTNKSKQYVSGKQKKDSTCNHRINKSQSVATQKNSLVYTVKFLGSCSVRHMWTLEPIMSNGQQKNMASFSPRQQSQLWWKLITVYGSLCKTTPPIAVIEY